MHPSSWVAAAVALALAAALVASPASAAVLMVGDSLGVGTEGALRAALGGVEVDGDNLGGRTSPAGVGIARSLLGPEHDALVFDLGTNDGGVETTLGSLAAARDLAGGRCLVFATINRPGADVEAANAAIRGFALETPNAALVDWSDVAASTPGVLQDDGVHATSAGYAFRGALFADAIASCLVDGGGGAAGGGDPAGVPDRAASTTKRPAAERAAAERRERPSLGERLLGAALERLGGGAADLAARAVATVAAAARGVAAALTPRGPEPVLGAPS